MILCIILMMMDLWLLDGNRHHINDNLCFTTGWLKYNDSMYYFDNNGTMRTGWLLDDNSGEWYYLQDDGRMVKGTMKCGYLFAQDGRWIKK